MKRNIKPATMASIVTVLASLSLAGCGSDEGGHKADPGQTGAIEPFTSVASASDASVQPGVQPRTNESVPADSLAPDVIAHVEQNVAAPGASVEITAQASKDAVEVFMWDGVGRKQSFAYDSTADVWRARYRVPLGIKGDKIGLSVTAKNGLDLRNRVWVFVRIERPASAETPEEQPESAPADTTGR
jgi:hypothetical protein